MADQLTQPRRARDGDPRELDRNRRLFLLARAQLAAGRADAVRLDAARRQWAAHRRRFS